MASKYNKENMTKFYEYCYLEDGIYYINIKEGQIL